MAERSSPALHDVQKASQTDREQLVQAEETAGRTQASGAMIKPHEAGAEPSGYRGDNPSTAGPGQTAVSSDTPENKTGHLNPSAPEDANITPGSMPAK